MSDCTGSAAPLYESVTALAARLGVQQPQWGGAAVCRFPDFRYISRNGRFTQVP